MRKVLILSGGTGQGHNSCAQAIREYFEDKNVSCTVCDAFSFISKGFAAFMSWGHSAMYRFFPGLFRWGYRVSEKHPAAFREGSPVYKLLTSGTERLHAYILSEGFDTVLCTHAFAAVMATQLVRQTACPVQTAYVATDYTCYPVMGSCDLQWVFVPCESLTEAYRACARPGRRVRATGIPIQRGFWLPCEKEEAKRLLNIPVGSKHLLMMCGSMGCGPMVKMLRAIAAELPGRAEVSVICGTNERLRKKLARRYAGNGRVHIVGYTDQIPLYMDAADLYLTKPGGISVTEAAAKALPMAFIDAVSGCERYNMNYFVELGAAVTAGSVGELVQKCVRLLSSEDELRHMRLALREYGQPDGAKLIYEELGHAENRDSRLP